MMQVLLEKAVHAGTTEDLHVSFPELNKHVEDPLNAGARASDALLDDLPMVVQSAENLHVPLEMLDHKTDLSKYVSSTYKLISETPHYFCREPGVERGHDVGT
jgi:hypothetical protein